MNRRAHSYVYAVLLAGSPAAGLAEDRWERSIYRTDDDAYTHNELVHGSVQRGHDLQGPDEDWMVMLGRTRHSYEVRVSSGTVTWTQIPEQIPEFGSFARVDASGTVLTPGAADGSLFHQATTLTVRWIAPGAGTEFLRAKGFHTFTAADTYDVEAYDTTYFLPRFNNSSSQVTVLVVQNTKDSPVTGEIHVYDAAGALLSTQPLSLPAQGVQVLNSAAVPALAGRSGSVTIAHLGGYGALAGKGVALEPATGFTFDTPLTPLPR
jgi:hypothetical protein